MRVFHWFLLAAVAASLDCLTTWYIFLSGGHDYNWFYSSTNIFQVWLLHIAVFLVMAAVSGLCVQPRYKKIPYIGLTLVWVIAGVWNIGIILVFWHVIPCIVPGWC